MADGRKIIILDGQVVRADAWLPYHPGGDKSILHMVGRDGTDEIKALHSKEAQAHMQKFVDRMNTRKMGYFLASDTGRNIQNAGIEARGRRSAICRRRFQHLEILHHHRQCSILKKQEMKFV